MIKIRALLTFCLMALLPHLAQAQAQAQNPSPAPTPAAAAKNAAAKNDSAALSSDALSAKALLEEIIVRRYSQDLGTRIAKDSFSMGAQLEITKLAMEDIPAQEPITDLMLGMLDPDELVKKAADGAGAKEMLGNFLSQYAIKNVAVSVGLNKSLVPEAKKAEVTEWLNSRLQQEFASNGKGTINFIESVAAAKEPRTFIDDLKDLQGLAGQVVLAIALMVGALLWGFSMRPTSVTKESVMKAEAQAVAAKDAEARETQLAIERRRDEQAALKKEINEITLRLVQLVPRTNEYFEAIIRNWCQMGETGRFRLVCFAEAVRQDLGKLPIPVDALEGVKKVFSQMPNVQLKEKRDALDKVYWDLLATMNLGSDAVTEPFSYLGGVNVDTVQNVLMDKNSKMRTLVALYMPDELRGEFVRSLSPENKKELLVAAAEMQTVSASDFKSIDQQIGQQLNGVGGAADVVRLEMTLQKIVSSLSPMEQILSLRELPNESLATFKQTAPSLAFLDQWPEDDLGRLVNLCTPDEIVNYIQVLPSAQEMILAVCRPMTAQMVKDELNRSSNLSDTDKNRLLENMLERLQILLSEKEIDLKRIFPDPKAPFKLHVAS